MKLEDQVVSIELARRLKELGVKQESAFYWAAWVSKKDDEPKYKKGLRFGSKPTTDFEFSNDLGAQRYYAAFTVAELGEMLPINMDAAHCDGSHRHDDYWTLSYYAPAGLSLPEGRSVHDESAMTEADARAKMLIYLVEIEAILLP